MPPAARFANANRPRSSVCTSLRRALMATSAPGIGAPDESATTPRTVPGCPATARSEHSESAIAPTIQSRSGAPPNPATMLPLRPSKGRAEGTTASVETPCVDEPTAGAHLARVGRTLHDRSARGFFRPVVPIETTDLHLPSKDLPPIRGEHEALLPRSADCFRSSSLVASIGLAGAPRAQRPRGPGRHPVRANRPSPDSRSKTANAYITELNISVSSNAQGRYTITIPR